MIRIVVIGALTLLVVACGGSPEMVATPAGPTPTRAAAALLTPTAGFEPIQFPADEAPHDTLTEWWYYTGHLFAADGTRYGFEYVIFQGNRAGFPTGYAAHFAITDGSKQAFVYDQRAGIPQQTSADRGFALSLGNWSMSGVEGVDQLQAEMPGYAIDLTLTATKPPVLHAGSGYLSLGDLGDTYYYSRTRMEVSGTLTTASGSVTVSGEAWMDHQWGNFIPAGDGGWDWFSVQLEDGSDLMAYVIRDGAGDVASTFGTVVAPNGEQYELDAEDFTLTATGSWTSPRSGATYPLGWTIDVPAEGWSLTLTPTLEEQELDTRASTGVIYWEGEVVVSGTANDEPISGFSYVELTGYAQ